ncbi:uncharacterized protein LOC134246209 [Saccostrea cucullata]|uniref:uncharacterized protein LOC134246209 n=1 Tax=Saccostrea cuccullata TaxID=36930 RepID=UPI002ED18C82
MFTFLFLGTSTSHHRVKRKIEQTFETKHIVALYNRTRINVPTLRHHLPGFLFTDANRNKHTVIIVRVLATQDRGSRRTGFIERLNNVISAKLKNGRCMMREYNPRTRPNTCSNPRHIEYYHCTVFMDEVEEGISMVEFNVQNHNDCRLSDKGWFTVGVRVDKTRTGVQAGTEWFFVDHLQRSMLIGGNSYVSSLLHHREKRDIDMNFQNRHIVAFEREIRYSKLRGSVVQYIKGQENRRKHTLIIAKVESTDIKSKRKNDVTIKLNRIVSQKLMQGSECQKVPYKPYGSSNQGASGQGRGAQKKTCPNSTSQKYFHCSILLNELESRILMAEFDLENSDICAYSENGTFTVGVKVDNTPTNSFFVDHLKESHLFPDIKTCQT